MANGPLERPDLAILAANAAALGIVANFSGLKLFESVDVRIPVAVYSLGAILALLATFMRFAFSQNLGRSPLPHPARILEEREKVERGEQRFIGYRARIFWASMTFLSSITLALLLRNGPGWVPPIFLSLAAIASLVFILSYFAISRIGGRIGRRFGARTEERLNVAAFSALIIGSVLLLAPGIAQGIEAAQDWTPPPPPKPYKAWQSELQLHQSNTVNTNVTVGGQAGSAGGTDAVCPAGPAGPPGPPGRDGRDGVCLVERAGPPPSCPAVCIRDGGKPFDARLEQLCSACEDTSAR